MNPRSLQPSEFLAPLTPMGRQPMNRWIEHGTGGSPYEPRGFFPSTTGNRMTPELDASLVWDRAARAAIVMPPDRSTLVDKRRASAPTPGPRKGGRRLVARLVPLAEGEGVSFSISPMIFLGIVAGVGLAYYSRRR